MTEITDLSLEELAKSLKNKQFSAVEAGRAFISKINRAKKLNAFITFDEDRLLKSADQADKNIKGGAASLLNGAPIGIKDIILTKGMRTTAGSKILENFVPPYDATVIKKIAAAGGLVLGKTNQDEFAMGSSNENSYYGPVLNPWDTSRVPGGSSGGSAVAVAASLAPAALGTDTGGSIRQPAALCGIVGLRPTYGRVSRYGVVAFASSLDQVGVFARNVKDCALMAQIISGHDALDSTSAALAVPDFTALASKPIKGLKVGIPAEYFIKGVNKEVEDAVRAAIKKIQELGAEIVEISLPHTEYAVAVYYVIAPAEASSNLARYDGVRYGYRAKGVKDLSELYRNSRSEGFGKEVKRRILIGNYVLSSGYYDAFYLKAQKVRSLVAKDFFTVFKDQCDVIACPTTPTTAFKIGEKTDDPLQMYLNDIFTIPVNLAGLPGLSVPCGFDSGGLPIGLQLIGNLWEEEKLLRTAYAYEQATDWHKKRPRIGEG
jgi:aspartyl-tRNA(Asn)/glutamyl-tRNA(Gln) amidotransferase subunit A